MQVCSECLERVRQARLLGRFCRQQRNVALFRWKQIKTQIDKIGPVDRLREARDLLDVKLHLAREELVDFRIVVVIIEQALKEFCFWIGQT